jgi:hypothetical protein
MSLEEHTPVLLESLKDAKLVPGNADSLITADFKPTTKLTISYGGRAVELGNLFRASECKTAPAVSFKPEVSDHPITPMECVLARLRKSTNAEPKT